MRATLNRMGLTSNCVTRKRMETIRIRLIMKTLMRCCRRVGMMRICPSSSSPHSSSQHNPSSPSQTSVYPGIAALVVITPTVTLHGSPNSLPSTIHAHGFIAQECENVTAAQRNSQSHSHTQTLVRTSINEQRNNQLLPPTMILWLMRTTTMIVDLATSIAQTVTVAVTGKTALPAQ